MRSATLSGISSTWVLLIVSVIIYNLMLVSLEGLDFSEHFGVVGGDEVNRHTGKLANIFLNKTSRLTPYDRIDHLDQFGGCSSPWRREGRS